MKKLAIHMTGLLNKILSIFKSKPLESIKVVEAYRRGKEIYFYILAPCQPGAFDFAGNRNDIFSAIADVYAQAGCDRMYREKRIRNTKETTKIAGPADIALILLNDDDKDVFPHYVVLYSNGRVIGGMKYNLDDGLFCKVIGISPAKFESIFRSRGISIKWLDEPLPLRCSEDKYCYLKSDHFR